MLPSGETISPSSKFPDRTASTLVPPAPQAFFLQSRSPSEEDFTHFFRLVFTPTARKRACRYLLVILRNDEIGFDSRTRCQFFLPMKTLRQEDLARRYLGTGSPYRN
jgi:hypothetical protein